MIQRTLFGAAGLLAVGLSIVAPNLHGQALPGQSTTVGSTVTGITAPSQRLRLVLPFPGVVLERKVRSGEAVKKDQVLLQLDDRAEQVALKSLNLEAASTAQIDAAIADLKLRQEQLKRKEKMLADRAAGVSEVEEARLQVEIGAIRQKLQEQERETKGLERDRQALKVEQMALKSPIDGEVEAIEVGIGEWADPQKPNGAVTVVKNDPLWVEVHLPTRQSQRLDRNTPLMVRNVDEDRATPAKIIYISPVADAASDTQLVRLELPNPQNRSSGLQVTVTLPDEVAALAERR